MNVGDTVKFVPCYTSQKCEGFSDILREPKRGTVIRVNEARRWYRVEYEIAPGLIGHECFKF